MAGNSGTLGSYVENRAFIMQHSSQKHIVLPRLPAVAFFGAAAMVLLHAALCLPAVTSRGYPPIHPFWESVALYVSFLGFAVLPFFEDSRPTRLILRNVAIPLMCFMNGLAYVNLTSARPRPGSSFGALGLVAQNFMEALITGLAFMIVAYPTVYVLERLAVGGWARVRSFSGVTDSGPAFRISLATLLVVMATVAVGCVATVQAPRLYDAWPRSEWTHDCRSNLRYIAIAMHNYHADHGSFPPAFLSDESGVPSHSWRVLLLPYLGLNDLHAAYDFDEPWNDPHNRKLLERIPPAYRCRWDSRNNPTATSYAVITGPGTIFDGDKSASWKRITDGTDKTILIVESPNSQIPWTAPRDLPMSDTVHEDVQSTHSGVRGIHFVFADAVIGWLGDEADPELIRALITPNGGEKVDDY